jgi:hypothetical protein
MVFNIQNAIFMKKLIVLLMLVPWAASAQTYEDDKRPRVVFEMIHCVNLITTNDGIEPVKFDSCAATVAGVLLAVTDTYATNDVHYLAVTEVRIVRNDTITFPFKYLNGDIGRKPAGPVICVIPRDEKSYIVICPALGTHRSFFQREEINPMAAYDGSVNPKIVGFIPDIDQRNLCDLVFELVPNKNHREKITEK